MSYDEETSASQDGLSHGSTGEMAGGEISGESSVPRGSEASRSRETIELLLVEDDDGDAVLVEDQLAEDLPNARVARSRSLTEALGALTSEIDCVLLDLRLPDASGMAAVERLRSSAPSIPLIVLTGLDNEAAGVSAVQAGAQDYLVKGTVGGGGLARSIRYAIGRHQTEETERELLLAQSQAREVTRLERGLAPRPLITGHSAWVASRYLAGRSRALLGGDFYDAVETLDGRLRLVIGDVCGHGADEAAIGVCLRSAWRALALAAEDLPLITRTLQRVFEHERHIPSLFATLFMLEIDAAGETAKLVQAGHPPPVLISGDSVSSLAETRSEPPIGIGRADWSEQLVELPSDWAILLYTDGVIEGHVGEGSERLGEDGLHELIVKHVAQHADWRGRPAALLDELVLSAERLNGRALNDDVAMVLVGAPTASTEER
jgi:serine phosphatase RsbU (regulator of sigma subunit)